MRIGDKDGRAGARLAASCIVLFLMLTSLANGNSIRQFSFQDKGLSEKQFKALKLKVRSGKANLDEAYLYMQEAEGRESWEIRKVLNPYLKKYPDPGFSKKNFLLHLRLFNGGDSLTFSRLRIAKEKFGNEMTKQERLTCELFLLMHAV